MNRYYRYIYRNRYYRYLYRYRYRPPDLDSSDLQGLLHPQVCQPHPGGGDVREEGLMTFKLEFSSYPKKVKTILPHPTMSKFELIFFRRPPHGMVMLRMMLLLMVMTINS